MADIGEFGYRLDPQIQRIDEPTRGRQVRRRLHRRGRGGGVQRVDQDETRAVPRARPHRQIGQISQIAYAPRSLGSHAVELGGQPPGPPGAQPRWQLQRAGGDDERRAGVERPDLQVQPVIAQRQVAGQLEGGLADPVGRRDRKAAVLFSSCRRPVRTVPSSSRIHSPTGSPWVTCTQNDDVSAGAGDDRRRQGARPVVAVVCDERSGPVVLGGSRDAQRPEHGDQRGLGHHDIVALPVQVFGRDAVAASQFDQRRGQLSHAANLAGRRAVAPAGQSTSRISRSSQVSRRTTSRAFPSRANTTGTRRAPLYWLDIV